jgi:glucokinase
MGDTRPVVGIDLGGTHFQVGVVDRAGTILRREGHKTRSERGAMPVVDDLARAVREIAAHAGLGGAGGVDGIAAVGIGAPGAIDAAATTVLEAPNLGWDNLPLARLMSERLGGVRIALDNDVNAAVLGENLFGAGENSADALGVWVGTGVGGGIIRNHRVDRGPLGSAGEIGRTVLFPDMPIDECQMEYHCSRMHVARQIDAAIGAGRASSLAGHAGEITAARMAEAYAAGDGLTREVVDRSAVLLGISIANAVSLTAIPLILLGGGMTEALGAPYAARIAEAARKWVFPRTLAAHIDVRVTRLRENAGLLGAAAIALG